MLLDQTGIILIVGWLFVWLTVVSFFLYRILTTYSRLTKGTKGNETVLKLLSDQKIHSEKLIDLLQRVEKIEKDSELHFQKFGLVRFNPFSETGGNQSFSLAILDGKKSGLVISSLHSRESTRVYAKKVKVGEANGSDFSKEENEALVQAQKN